MADDGWLEPRTRIPFVGIIAIVLIVSVVAIFIKTQLGPLFPASDITIQTSEDGAPAVAGKASNSFAGIREVTLDRKERLQGIMSTTAGSRIYTIDVPAKLLTISDGASREEIILTSVDQELIATFEYADINTRIAIAPAERTMSYSEPGKSSYPTIIALGDITSYEGYFTFRNQNYLFQYFPAGDNAVITGSTQATVALTQSGTTYTGVWNDGKNERPVTVDMEELKATIEEVY